LNDKHFFPPWIRQIQNWAVTVGSALICSMLLLTRFPGMELLGIAPNWMAIWVVAWSVKRKPYQGILAGLAAGFLLDGMTRPEPTHTIGLALVGFLTASLQKSRYIQEDFISVASIVFGMVLVAETVMAVQFLLVGDRDFAVIWQNYQIISLASALLSSLWAPVIYVPLKLLWQRTKSE
jgi:rod shape-determining protein MreD